MNLVSRKVSLFLGLAVLLIFAIYFVANISKFKLLLDVKLWVLLLIALANCGIVLANGVFIKFILEPFNKVIPITEATYVSLISSVGNFFAPAGAGFGFRAVYLKKKHGLPYNEYVSTLSGNYIIAFLISSVFGLLALFALRGHYNNQYLILMLLFSGIMLGSIFMSLVRPPRIEEDGLPKNKKLRMLLRTLLQVMNGWNKITANKKLMTKLIAITVVNFLFSVLIIKLEIFSLNLSIGFAQLLLFSVLSSLSVFINITPANLGIKEAIYIFSSSILGFSVTQILSIALIDRGILFLVLALSWLGFGHKTLAKA